MKKLALGVVMALILASFASASASANQRQFAAGSYPYSIQGSGNMIISASGASAECEATLQTGSLNGETPLVSAQPSGKCHWGSSSSTISSNGCNFELNSDFSTVGIGPAGCGPMTVPLGTGPFSSCTVSIVPQNGIPATYGATTSGGLPAVSLSISTSTLKYKACGTGELKEDGHLDSNLTLIARNGAGAQTSLSLTPASYLNGLVAEKYPASLASRNGTEAKFTLDGSSGHCGATYAGTLTGVDFGPRLVPTLSSCVYGGFVSTINTNGCQFFASVYTGEEEIACPAGKAMTYAVPNYGCAATIGSQSFPSGATSSNTTGKNGRSAINVGINMSGLTYTVTNDSGWLCPFNGTGTRSNGTYTDAIVLEGQDSAGPIAIKIGA